MTHVPYAPADLSQLIAYTECIYLIFLWNWQLHTTILYQAGTSHINSLLPDGNTIVSVAETNRITDTACSMTWTKKLSGVPSTSLLSHDLHL